jgi:hypothetical protein
VLFVILCRNPLFGFDGAKLRRFWVLTKHLCGIVCANSPFFDEGQQIGVYSFFYSFLLKYAVISRLFRTFAAKS